MTNEEKGLRIAIFDGRAQQGKTYSEGDLELSALTEKYLTDLNYLIPVAYKLYNQLIFMGLLKSKVYFEDVLRRLNQERNGYYQALFDEIYTGIKVIENKP